MLTHEHDTGVHQDIIFATLVQRQHAQHAKASHLAIAPGGGLKGLKLAGSWQASIQGYWHQP